MIIGLGGERRCGPWFDRIGPDEGHAVSLFGEWLGLSMETRESGLRANPTTAPALGHILLFVCVYPRTLRNCHTPEDRPYFPTSFELVKSLKGLVATTSGPNFFRPADWNVHRSLS